MELFFLKREIKIYEQKVREEYQNWVDCRRFCSGITKLALILRQHNMCSILTLSFLSKTLGVAGLCLDIVGAIRLFNYSPKPYEKIDRAEYRSYIGDSPEIGKWLAQKLESMIDDINKENRNRHLKSKKALQFLIWGFVLQALSIFLSFNFN